MGEDSGSVHFFKSFQYKEPLSPTINAIFARKLFPWKSKLLFVLVNKSLKLHWKRLERTDSLLSWSYFEKNYEKAAHPTTEFWAKITFITPGRWHFYWKTGRKRWTYLPVFAKKSSNIDWERLKRNDSFKNERKFWKKK